MDCADEGYVTGAKDGMIRLWDSDFKPITKVDLTQTSDGYPGAASHILLVLVAPTYTCIILCFTNI